MEMGRAAKAAKAALFFTEAFDQKEKASGQLNKMRHKEESNNHSADRCQIALRL